MQTVLQIFYPVFHQKVSYALALLAWMLKNKDFIIAPTKSYGYVTRLAVIYTLHPQVYKSSHNRSGARDKYLAIRARVTFLHRNVR